MIVVDRLIVGGLKFVLGKIVDAVNAELDDEGALREELLAAQMRHELGEIDDEELDRIEREVLARLREIKARRGETTTATTKGYKVTGVEASVLGDEEGEGKKGGR